MACLSMARREWSHTDRLQMRGNEHNKPAKCQHRLTRSCWLSCCESRRFGVDWWESDPNCPSHNSIGIAKNVLRYKGVNSSSILVMHMNRNADHSTHHRIGRTQPIPPLGDFIGEQGHTVESCFDFISQAIRSLRNEWNAICWLFRFAVCSFLWM